MLFCGIPCVASDVCERFPGAFLYQSDSFDDFVLATSVALASPNSNNSSLHSPLMRSFDPVVTMLREDFPLTIF